MKLSHGKENSSIVPMCEIKRMPTAEQKNNNKNKKTPRPSLKQKQVILSREELSTLFIYISSAFPLWSKKKEKKRYLDVHTHMGTLQVHYTCRFSVFPSPLTSHPHSSSKISLEMSPSFITSNIQ